MLDWLNFWQKIPVSEIKAAQHLELAKTVTPEKFIARQHPQKTSNWPILHVAGNAVYWGRVDDFQVPRRRFYRTDKRGIEQALTQLPIQHQRQWNARAKAILSTYFDQFDGQLVRIQGLDSKGASITQEGHYCWQYAVQLEAQSTGLNAPVEQQTRHFELCLSGETFQEMTLKEVHPS